MPVPKVFAWSADSTNPVGAEYIVMERIPGIQIFKKWDEMGESNRISLIKRITQWERELSEIQFPASGSLYYKSSLKDEERIPLDPVVDPEGAFCAGPSCDLAWSVKRDHPSIYCGPWKTISEMGISLVERSLSNSMDHPNPKLPASLNGPAEERSAILKMAKETIPAVANNPKLLEQSQPTLWHTDLHMGNIFVAEVDPGEVTGFIDWQHCSISRLFLQARWPVFVSLPEDYQKGLVMPQLPPDFEDMDDEEKEIALYNKAKATWTKAYEVATFLNNKKAWKAMQVPLLFKDIFRRCGETWDEGILPLREVLIELFLSQADLGFRERALSLNFTEEQIAQYAKEFEIYEEWHGLHKFVKEMLDTDNDGWISSNRDLNEVRTRNKMLFDYYISKPGISKRSDEIQRMWPFALDI
ncbi:Phosphotransferase enzyme family [Aspergillus sclerotialis]|uniref:Altered inheritance of mitochondria protein 9, mitochondrial n=1 Tax=Aspergillus sclerotialis TaxID=2070753 RepID=A0A3A2ZLJ7_9EURO|nr:Phosphotransferase enzyme family [Aspergillus sclerotialis]